jgi:hypothetical protein
VTFFGVDLDRGQHQVVVLAAQLVDLVDIPEVVVLGKADAVEAGGLRLLYEVARVEGGVPGEGAGVRVQVNEHSKRF